MNNLPELMVITMEECGELTQAASKVWRKYSRTGKITADTRKKLIEEAGDVRCMIDLLIENGLMTEHDVTERAQIKRAKLKKWSTLIDEPADK